MTAAQVRAATADDVAAVGALAELAGLFPAEIAPEIMAPALDGAADLWLVAETEATVTGFAFCEPERMADRVWNMLALGVDPSQRRRGVGRALTTALMARLETEGARMLIVETSSLPEQTAARAFYPSLGFEEEARIRDFYADGDHKIVFRRMLAEGAA